MKKDKKITTFEEHLEERYGKIGSKTRTDLLLEKLLKMNVNNQT
jgi:hypothetical protein